MSIAFLIVWMSDSPTAQIILILLIFLGYLMLDLGAKPFKEPKDNFLEVLKGVLYALTLIFFLVLARNQDTMDPETQYYFIGFPVIGFIALIILGNIFVVMFFTIKNLCKKKVNPDPSRMPKLDESQMSLAKQKENLPSRIHGQKPFSDSQNISKESEIQRQLTPISANQESVIDIRTKKKINHRRRLHNHKVLTQNITAQSISTSVQDTSSQSLT